MVASRVTSAVFSLAKSLLTVAGGTIPSTVGDISSSAAAANIPPAKPIPLILSLNDSNRQIMSIVMSPAAADGKYQLAALTDSLGRVIYLSFNFILFHLFFFRFLLVIIFFFLFLGNVN
jgi:hypothetical protein